MNLFKKDTILWLVANIFLIYLFFFLTPALNFDWQMLSVVLSFPVFLFGIFMAFILADRYERLNDLKKLTSRENSYWRNIISLSEGSTNAKQIFNELDKYFCSLYDYYIEDYYYTEPFFENIRKLFKEDRTKSQLNEKILDNLNELNHVRQEAAVTVNDKLSTNQWFLVVLLTISLIIAILCL
jgi:K+-sensing histidine kinase KdpD